MNEQFKGRIRLVVSAVFPKRCAFCGKLIPGDVDVCGKCSDSLPLIKEPVCKSCGRGKDFCDCKGRENYFDGITAPFYYEDEVKNGLQSFKFKGRKSNAAVYADYMVKSAELSFPKTDFDYITEVPMTEKSEKERGYNQCSLLCKAFSEKSGIPYKKGILKKIYETPKQHGVNAYLRKGNLIGVFDAADVADIKDKTILLCDDISTSGETLNECAKMLWLNGAKSVCCVTVALTKAEKKKKQPE